MIAWLEELDRTVVLAINGLNTPLLDEIMWWISSKILWIPLYLFLFYLAYRKLGIKNAFYFLAFTLFTIVVADFISSYLIKESIQRYRPSHHLALKDHLHFYQISKKDYYTGGEYGFVSSHATNFFALANCFLLVFKPAYRKMCVALFLIAALICFSRIYLGVHYLSDIIGGTILGLGVSYLLFSFIWKKLPPGKIQHLS